MENSLYSTRELIIDKLKYSHGLTSHELSLLCGVSEHTIRFHLRNLINDGSVRKCKPENIIIKPGRHYHIFKIADKPDNNIIESLCLSLIDLLENNKIGDLDWKNNVARTLIGSLQQPTKTGTLSLLKLIEWLNNSHYMANWIAGKDGPIIQFHNCPYRRIRDHSDSCCQIDMEMLQIFSGFTWKQTECIQWNEQLGKCEFQIDTPSLK
jgi:predicted ArsR family transcriptional regulator